MTAPAAPFSVRCGRRGAIGLDHRVVSRVIAPVLSDKSHGLLTPQRPGPPQLFQRDDVGIAGRHDDEDIITEIDVRFRLRQRGLHIDGNRRVGRERDTAWKSTRVRPLEILDSPGATPGRSQPPSIARPLRIDMSPPHRDRSTPSLLYGCHQSGSEMVETHPVRMANKSAGERSMPVMAPRYLRPGPRARPVCRAAGEGSHRPH